jgi:endonuclease/exonuclease/phosphatase family metal-dependent hydrolase
MRLVSLNTWKADGDYPRRLVAMASGLAALSADVIALQEDLRTMNGETHTALALARSLSMHLAWVPARMKVRPVSMHPTASTCGLAVLSRRPVLEQHALVLPQDPDDGERVAQCVRLAGDKGDWWLVNLHLTHLDERAGLRASQLEAAYRGMLRLAPGQPTVFCGDFNAAAHAPELVACLRPQGALTDAFAGLSKVTHITPTQQALDLDQVFLLDPASGSPWQVRAAGVVLDRPDWQGVMPSDHFGVCVDL